MKTLVYLLAGISLVAFGVHCYNDAGTIAMAPTPVVAESRVVVSPQGWSVEPVAPASPSESSSRPAVKPPEPASHVAEVVGPVVAPPRANHYASASWGQPAQVQVNGPDIVAPFTGLILLVGMLAILFIFIRSARRGRLAAPSDESALVHELARRAQDLSLRMEALETILLDRTRVTR